MRRFDPGPAIRSEGFFQHRTDPRARLISAAVLLAGISFAHDPASFLVASAVVISGLIAARVRLRALLLRALAVTALPLTFVAINYATGNTERATLLLARSVLSAGVLIALTAVTPLPEISSAMSRLGAPHVLTETIHLLYRYLFVLTDQALRMRDAVSCRGGSGSMLAAGGTVGVLFARSYSRAEGVHRAMLSRGYTGSLPGTHERSIRPADAMMFTLCAFTALATMVRNALNG